MYSREELEAIHTIIKRKLVEYCEFANKKQFSEMVEIFSDDSVLILPDNKIVGKQKIKQYYEELFHKFRFPEISISSQSIYEINGKIYEMGINNTKFSLRSTLMQTKGNYVSIWKNLGKDWVIEEDLIPPMPDIS